MLTSPSVCAGFTSSFTSRRLLLLALTGNARVTKL